MADYDLFVIGAGSGGVACARRSASHGARVAICEDDRAGGTCVIRGCVPKKLMRYGAALGGAMGAAHGYGWDYDNLRFSWQHLVDVRNREIDRLNGVYITMLGKAGVNLIDGRGRITGPGEVTVAGQTYTADNIVIATGGKPSTVPVPGIEHAITSDELLEGSLPTPEKVAVVGAGYIGLELASILNGLQIDTTMILRADLPLRGFDQTLREHLAGEVQKQGLKLLTGRNVTSIDKVAEGFVVHTDQGEALAVDQVLYTTGRKPLPNTQDVGAREQGVIMEEDGTILVGPDYQTNIPGIYCVGDCSNHAGHGLSASQHDLTPVAIAEGRCIAEKLFNNRDEPVIYDTLPTAIFSIPEAASVGISEEEARKRSHDIAIFQTAFRPMFYTLSGGQDRTLMKMIVERGTDKVLGCHMVGDDAGEMLQGMAVAMTAGATKADFDKTIGIHPSSAEEWVTLYTPHTP